MIPLHDSTTQCGGAWFRDYYHYQTKLEQGCREMDENNDKY